MKISKLSEIQLESILESTARINLWVGAVRSGKTFASNIRFLEYCKIGPPGNMLLAGKTERTIARNVIEPMKEMFGEELVRTNYGRGEAYIAGRKCYLFGANDIRAESKLRGGTFAGGLGDEVSTWGIDFFKMALSRFSVDGSKFFATTNPDSPLHPLKTEFIDRANELDMRIWNLNLSDNKSLSEDYKQSLMKEYTGLWYSRYILGLWVVAEGSIYSMFEKEKHVVDTLPEMKQFWVGVDYGTSNPCVFLLLGLGADDCFYVVNEYCYDSKKHYGKVKTDAQYSIDYQKWIGNTKPKYVFIDPSAASFIAQLHIDKVRNLAIANNSVIPGIRKISTLLGLEKLKIHSSCTNLINEFASYRWNEKSKIEEPIKDNDHSLDALRYIINGTETVWRRAIKLC